MKTFVLRPAFNNPNFRDSSSKTNYFNIILNCSFILEFLALFYTGTVTMRVRFYVLGSSIVDITSWRRRCWIAGV